MPFHFIDLIIQKTLTRRCLWIHHIMNVLLQMLLMLHHIVSYTTCNKTKATQHFFELFNHLWTFMTSCNGNCCIIHNEWNMKTFNVNCCSTNIFFFQFDFSLVHLSSRKRNILFSDWNDFHPVFAHLLIKFTFTKHKNLFSA